MPSTMPLRRFTCVRYLLTFTAKTKVCGVLDTQPSTVFTVGRR
jgi:hypothetical protein